MHYDVVVIGAGIYGLYAATRSAEIKKRVLLIDCDSNLMDRATYVNQARVHSGYHYPRSIFTAMKSAGYFDRFVQDYGFCINKAFDQIYATSYEFSYTNGDQYKRFCEMSGIPIEEIDPEKYFRKGLCDRAFKTIEYTYDARILRDYYVDEINRMDSLDVLTNTRIVYVEKNTDEYNLRLSNNTEVQTEFVLNTTYASVNQVSELFGADLIKMKYELCEIILCDVNQELKTAGVTVMDGPFFSIMPFGKSGFHSLTSVCFTPHETSYKLLPEFSCQKKNCECTNTTLLNCNYCSFRPKSAYDYMNALAKKYLKDNTIISYRGSIFSVKPILIEAELDDSRPTVIKEMSKTPRLYSVLSGKINTIYDLDEVIYGYDIMLYT